MLLFSICLLVLSGVSLYFFANRRQRSASGRSLYAAPPADWPDVPFVELGVFGKAGRINAPVAKTPKKDVRRFATLEETQSFVVDIMERIRGPLPKVTLCLSDQDGPDWTDILLDGRIVAHVRTSALVSLDPVDNSAAS